MIFMLFFIGILVGSLFRLIYLGFGAEWIRYKKEKEHETQFIVDRLKGIR